MKRMPVTPATPWAASTSRDDHSSLHSRPYHDSRAHRLLRGSCACLPDPTKSWKSIPAEVEDEGGELRRSGLQLRRGR